MTPYRLIRRNYECCYCYYDCCWFLSIIEFNFWLWLQFNGCSWFLSTVWDLMTLYRLITTTIRARRMVVLLPWLRRTSFLKESVDKSLMNAFSLFEQLFPTLLRYTKLRLLFSNFVEIELNNWNIYSNCHWKWT